MKKYKFAAKTLNIISGTGRLLANDHIAIVDEKHGPTMALVKKHNGVDQSPPKKEAKKKKGDK